MCAIVCMRKSEGKFVELVLSFHSCLDSEDLTQVFQAFVAVFTMWPLVITSYLSLRHDG